MLGTKKKKLNINSIVSKEMTKKQEFWQFWFKGLNVKGEGAYSKI